MFTLTLKCPQCDAVVSHCTDSTLAVNRVETDSRRCQDCIKTTRSNGLRAPTPVPKHLIDSTAIGTGAGMFKGKQKQARMTGKILYGIP